MTQTLHMITLIRGVWQTSSGRYSCNFSWYWGSLSPSCALLEANVTTMGSWCVHRLGAHAHALSATQLISSAWWCASWEPGHQGVSMSPSAAPGTAADAIQRACHVSVDFNGTYSALAELDLPPCKIYQTWVRCHIRQMTMWVLFVMELLSRTLKI